jgi:hypothetical protein
MDVDTAEVQEVHVAGGYLAMALCRRADPRTGISHFRALAGQPAYLVAVSAPVHHLGNSSHSVTPLANPRPIWAALGVTTRLTLYHLVVKRLRHPSSAIYSTPTTGFARLCATVNQSVCRTCPVYSQ